MSYVWCGADGWGYCFNVIDVFTRQWLAFVLAGRAHAPPCHNGGEQCGGPAANPVLPGLTLRVDNGSQYTSREFRSSVAALGITLEYIYVNTPEQNGHIESFHKTLKKEYVWPREFADIQEARGNACRIRRLQPPQNPLCAGVLTPSESLPVQL